MTAAAHEQRFLLAQRFAQNPRTSFAVGTDKRRPARGNVLCGVHKRHPVYHIPALSHVVAVQNGHAAHRMAIQNGLCQLLIAIFLHKTSLSDG